jgi:hypothetical protein
MGVKPQEYFDSFIGRKFGRLLVIKHITKYDNRAYFICKCDCGNLNECKLSHLKSGLIKSCGCLARELASKRFKGRVSPTLLPDNLGAKKRIYNSYKKEAEKRGLEFNLEFDYFIELVQKNCYYDNVIPTREVKNNESRSKFICNGIDRKDNKIGYTIENSVPCCKMCNFKKSSTDHNEFLNWIKTIYENLNLGDFK